MLIDLPDDLIGSYTWLTYEFMWMYPFIPLPHILKLYSVSIILMINDDDFSDGDDDDDDDDDDYSDADCD